MQPLWALCGVHINLMFDQVPWVAEFLFTYIVVRRSLTSGENSLIPILVTCHRETLLTLDTVIKSLSRVNSFMCLQVYCKGEPFHTLVAAIRSLSCMNFMCLQGTCHRETFVTLVTCKRSLTNVNLLMFLQVTCHREALLTLVAVIRSLSSALWANRGTE